MLESAIDTRPYWIESTPMPRFEKLSRDHRVDVAIIGGGITGLTAAYLLTAVGKSVAVLERTRCALVDTGHTTAHLTMVTDTRLSELVKTFGRDHARAAWDAGLAAIAQIDEIVRQESIACDFAWVLGYLHAPRRVTAERRGRFQGGSGPGGGAGVRCLICIGCATDGRPGCPLRGSGTLPSAQVPRRPRACH